MNKVVVHKFRLSDVEDPEIYAAQPIYEWQQTEVGQWVMAHSKPEPSWNISIDYQSYGYQVRIVAELNDIDTTYYHLKYANTGH